MKPHLLSCLLALPLTAWTQGTTEAPVIADAAALPQPADSTAGALEAVERTAHATTWQITEQLTNDLTGEVSLRPVQFVELADGLNSRDASGAWKPTRPEFTRVPGGFAVTTGTVSVLERCRFSLSTARCSGHDRRVPARRQPHQRVESGPCTRAV